jgi:aspartate/methionine/tyrosine aminotransferase
VPTGTSTDGGTVGIYQRMTALAAELGAVNLSQGIPEPVHDALWRAAIGAELPYAQHQYTPTGGLPALRDVVAARYPAGAPRPVITSGCTESLVCLLLGLAAEGCDTVVWPEPCYSYYPGMARIAGLTPHAVPLGLDGPAPELDPARLEAALAAPGPRGVLLLNSPHNPSGWVLSEAGWEELLGIAARHGTRIVLDDVYRDFRYAGPPPPYAGLLATGRAAIAGAVSKSYAATGLRLGWYLAPEPLARRAEDAHMHLSNCAPDLLQRAAVRLLAQVDGDALERTAAVYRRKRDTLVAALTGTGFSVLAPDGGHFVMARPAEGFTSGDLAPGAADGPADHLLRTAGVAALPLDGFFAVPRPGWLRFSFAAPEDAVAEAARRLRAHRPAGPYATGGGRDLTIPGAAARPHRERVT